MQLEFFLVLLGYFFLILSVSFLASRKVKSQEGFFLASRNLPAFLVFVSVTASWIGATSTLVSVDDAYQYGISAFWVMGVPAILTVLGFAFLLVRPIRKIPVMTLPELVEMRYGKLVRHIASLLIVWYMILLSASQMVAIGNLLKSFLGITYFNALLMGTVVVLVYSVFGGFFSVVLTDGIQFFLLMAGLISLFVFLNKNTSIQEISMLASNLGKTEYFNFLFNIKRNLLMVLSFTCAWLVSPIVWQRIQASRTEKAARQGLLGSAGVLFFVYWSIVLIGLFSLSQFPSGEQSGPLLLALIFSKIGFALGAILFIAIVAAIMSTMDTSINTGALSLTRDIFQKIFPSSDEQMLVTIGRIATVIVTGLAFIIATQLQSILQTLGLASEIMAEGFFIPGMVMLFTRKKMPTAGFLSGGYSVIGFLCSLDLLSVDCPAWPNSVPYGLACGLMGFVIGMVIDKYRKS